jgi:light-regulated signal transduction histidine kinase (bacteriophytochrome)
VDKIAMAAEDEVSAGLHGDAELRRALEECRAARDAAERELHDFVYAASHDLQEPLRAVSAYGQLLQRRLASDAEVSELTSFIVDGASRATALVQALLAYSRAGASPRIQTVSLSSVLQTALFKLSRRIRESGAEIICGELAEVAMDEAQLAQVFEQLLANAMLYTAGDAPRIEITAEESDDAVTVSLRDNGKGIEPRFPALQAAAWERSGGKRAGSRGLPQDRRRAWRADLGGKRRPARVDVQVCGAGLGPVERAQRWCISTAS